MFIGNNMQHVWFGQGITWMIVILALGAFAWVDLPADEATGSKQNIEASQSEK